MIERNVDIPFVARLARREKQIQQNYRPIIAVHKWFARRPGTLFRSLLLSEFAVEPLQDVYYRSNNFPDVRVADPFMGGGTPLIEANRLGCHVTGIDINPMAYWIVRQEIEHLDLTAYEQAATGLRNALEEEIGSLYQTQCTICGNLEAPVKYFLWVKTKNCWKCEQNFDLFPGYLLAKDVRHPKNVFVCPICGELTETENRRQPGLCHHCQSPLSLKGPAKRSRCECPHCRSMNTFPNSTDGVPHHRLFALDYHCPTCKPTHKGRFFKKPDDRDLKNLTKAEERWTHLNSDYVPTDRIPKGDETNRLHRWGYQFYHQMFNTRQLLGLELSARLIARTTDERSRNALATNLSDLLRYQNMLCRYDPMALKSLDIFSVHGFPVGLIQCESNLLGILDPSQKPIGSGGWANIIEKYRKAKSYCDHPFEIRYQGRKKETVFTEAEWIGDHRHPDNGAPSRSVQIVCADAATIELPAASLDAVFTDPPYFGNVQYAELMDFCYVWLRRLAGEALAVFESHTTRNPNELTGNENMGRGLPHFTAGLSAVFQNMAKALKPGAPLAFTYHHNEIDAYYPVAVAILDAGLICSAALPCPAEMSASIHISGTGSSTVDTVFVCRTHGTIPRSWIVNDPAGVAKLVQLDLQHLKAGEVKPTAGDTRCIAYGHLIRLAIWSLRREWERNLPPNMKLVRIAEWLREFGGWPAVRQHLEKTKIRSDSNLQPTLFEKEARYGSTDDTISF